MNQIAVYFVPCEPAPVGGYNVQWRVFGSADPYTDAGNFFTSPAVFTDNVNPDNTSYEGIIKSDCAESGEDPNFGNIMVWSAIAESSGPEAVTMNWNYINGVGTGGRFKILSNGILRANVTATGSGSLSVDIGDFIEVLVQTTLAGTAEIDISGPYNNTTSGPHIWGDEFTVVAGTYTINGQST